MSKKVLNIDGITNELEGASLFFSKSTSPLPPSNLKPDGMQSLETGLSSAPITQDEPAIDNHLVNDLQNHKTDELSNEPTNDKTKEETKEIKIERKKELSNMRYNVRRKIHHTFDIFADQLLSLRELTIAQEITFGERVLIGDLVQQALDLFISKQRNK